MTTTVTKTVEHYDGNGNLVGKTIETVVETCDMQTPDK